MKLRYALFFFFPPGKFENWNFLLSSDLADTVKLTWPNLRCLFSHSDLYKWAAQLVLGASPPLSVGNTQCSRGSWPAWCWWVRPAFQKEMCARHPLLCILWSSQGGPLLLLEVTTTWDPSWILLFFSSMVYFSFISLCRLLRSIVSHIASIQTSYRGACRPNLF